MDEVHKKDFDLDDLVLIPGLIDFLCFLKNNNVEAHIATGSSQDFVFKVLELFKIKKYFSHILTGDQVKESKPSPKIYLELRRKINNESAFVIEDSSAGIISAKKAKFFVISLIEHDESDLFVSDFFELLKIIS